MPTFAIRNLDTNPEHVASKWFERRSDGFEVQDMRATEVKQLLRAEEVRIASNISFRLERRLEEQPFKFLRAVALVQDPQAITAHEASEVHAAAPQPQVIYSVSMPNTLSQAQHHAHASLVLTGADMPGTRTEAPATGT